MKFGEHSTVIVYQDQNLINYNLDFADVNVSLSCEGVNQNDIFIFENPDNYKFGANGTFEGLKNCTYKIESSVDLEFDGYNPYLSEPNCVETTSEMQVGCDEEKHIFKFEDICERGDILSLIHI